MFLPVISIYLSNTNHTLNWGEERGDRLPLETGVPPLRKTEIWKIFEIFENAMNLRNNAPPEISQFNVCPYPLFKHDCGA